MFKNDHTEYRIVIFGCYYSNSSKVENPTNTNIKYNYSVTTI